MFGSVEDQAHEVRKVKELMRKEEGAACDLKGRPVVGALVDLEREAALEWIGSLAEVWTDIIVVDVWHADHLAILRQIQAVKAEHDWLQLMAGNVQTRAGAKDVIDAGTDTIVVGNGFSSFAEATELSGVGVPGLSALMDVEDVASLYGRPIICSMGVCSTASVVKALAAGAAAVVLNTLVPNTTSQVMAHIATQVRESLRYVEAGSIAELREKAEFIRIRPPLLPDPASPQECQTPRQYESGRFHERQQTSPVTDQRSLTTCKYLAVLSIIPCRSAPWSRMNTM